MSTRINQPGYHFFFFFDMFSALIFIFPLWRSGSQELVPFGLVRFFMVSEQGQNT